MQMLNRLNRPEQNNVAEIFRRAANSKNHGEAEPVPKIRRASGPRRVRSRLRCFVMLPMLGARIPAILGVYRIPPRAKRCAAWGGSAAPGPARKYRRSPVEAAPRPGILQKSFPKL